MSIEVIAADPAESKRHADSLRRRIDKLTASGRLFDDVKLLLLAEAHTYLVSLLMSLEHLREIEALLGKDWVKSKQDVVDLAELGKYDREFDEGEDED